MTFNVKEIPASGQEITDDDVKILLECIYSKWYTEWKYCAKFRNKLSEVMGQHHVILTNSGSSASLVAMLTACEFYKDKYVLTCATGFPTTVAPIYQAGRIPIYVDIDPYTLSPDFEQIEYALKKYGKDIAGCIFAHTLGFPFDELELIYLFAKYKSDAFIIADCCDALGAKLSDGKPVGTFADLSTLSFFPAHQITSGEGGAVITDKTLFQKVADSYVNWGRDCYCLPGNQNSCGKRFEQDEKIRGRLPEGWDHKYIFSRLGYNLKMTEFQAALGWSQLQRLDGFVTDRICNFYYLRASLSETLGFELSLGNSRPSPFGFYILEQSGRCKELIAHLEKNKISTRRVFGGNLIHQPAFMDLPHILAGELKGSNQIMNEAFWIGCQPALTQENLDYMVYTIKEFYK